MKKKSLIIVIIIAAISAMSIYLMTRPKALGNIRRSYSEKITVTSNISFSGKAGERIKIRQQNRKHFSLWMAQIHML